MKKKRILQINKLYYPYVGGIEKVVQQIAEGLADKTEMKVLVSSKSRKLIVEEINGVEIIRQPSIGMVGNLPITIGLTMKLRSIMDKIDIIHLHMPYPFGDLACLLSRYKGKVVIWWHSDIVRQKKMMLLYKPIMNRMLQRADAIIVATKGHIEGSEYLKPYQNKCIIIPFGVDVKLEAEADRYIAKRQCFVRKTQKVQFLFIGRLVYYKGCEILLKAFINVKDAELTIVGSGEMEHKLKELANIYHLEDRVSFCGGVEEKELYKYFETCDVFVLPSILKSEAFGLVQIEAMSFAKPVINTNLSSGVPYVSIDKLTGLTVPPGDERALEQAMQWFVEHEEERVEMGMRARKRMKEEYKLQTMLERVFKLYNIL